VTARVSPADRIPVEIDELFASRGDLGEVLEKVAQLGARLLLQSALEAEVTEFLGRTRYERRHGPEDARAGSRNGYNSTTTKSRLTIRPLSVVKERDEYLVGNSEMGRVSRTFRGWLGGSTAAGFGGERRPGGRGGIRDGRAGRGGGGLRRESRRRRVGDGRRRATRRSGYRCTATRLARGRPPGAGPALLLAPSLDDLRPGWGHR
jgi:hypothetical protein